MDEKGFVEGVRRYMSQLREEKRYSSAKSYQDALNSFIKYSGTENISYSDINKANLHRYEAYLLEKGCMCNTVSTYMRRIRCVYNKAIEDGDAEYIPGLFQGVFTGVESKRSCPCNIPPLTPMRWLMCLVYPTRPRLIYTVI